MNNVRIQIGNQLYDEIEVKLKNVVNYPTTKDGWASEI